VALRTPLYDAHLAASARMVEFAVRHAGPVPGSARGACGVRNAVGMFDVSHMGEITLKARAPWRPRSGGHQRPLQVQRWAGAVQRPLQREGRRDRRRHRLPLFPGAAVHLRECERAGQGLRVDAGPRREGVVVSQRSDDWAQIAVPGSARRRSCRFALRAARARPCVLSSARRRSRESGGASSPGRLHRRGRLRGVRSAIRCAAALGRPAGKRGRSCGLGARDSLRLEVAYRLYGNDMDEEHTPLEAGSAGS